MKNFEQELYDFLTGTGRCASVPMPVHVTMAGELPVFDCGEGRLAVVAVPLDYFVRGGSVAELRQAAGAVAAAGTVYVYEDRWRGAGPLTRSMLEVRLGQGMRVFARNCGVRIITAETAAAFLERNHVYGPARSEIRLGLFRERATGAGEAAMDRTPQLAAVAVFSSGRRMDGGILSYEWVRYASLRGVRVTGGMGRLLEAFADGVRERSGSEPFEVMTYSDEEWFDGGSYAGLGFVEAGRRQPVAFLCPPDGSWRVHEGKFMTDRRFRAMARDTDLPSCTVRVLNLGSLRFVRRFD